MRGVRGFLRPHPARRADPDSSAVQPAGVGWRAIGGTCDPEPLGEFDGWYFDRNYGQAMAERAPPPVIASLRIWSFPRFGEAFLHGHAFFE
ncbi:MAG: hypothetical protein QHG99_05535 [Methanomicrobiales archaeon]|nr:hypothetical protein [Methanomicrobiales archaeon]